MTVLRSTTEVDGGDLFVFVTELAADFETRFGVSGLLCRSDVAGSRATRRRIWPSGQFLIALLRIGVTQSI